MSLYADYIKEREDREMIEESYGFITYRFFPGEKICYLVDLYIKPDARRHGYGSILTDRLCEIAKAEYCEKLYTSVDIGANGVDESMMAILDYGFKIEKMNQGTSMIYFSKDLEE